MVLILLAWGKYWMWGNENQVLSTLYSVNKFDKYYVIFTNQGFFFKSIKFLEVEKVQRKSVITENYQQSFVLQMLTFLPRPFCLSSHACLFPMHSIPQIQLSPSPFIVTRQNSSRKKKIQLDQNKWNTHLPFFKCFGIFRQVFPPVKINVFRDMSRVPTIMLSDISSSQCGIYTSYTVTLGWALGLLPRLMFMLKEAQELL